MSSTNLRFNPWGYAVLFPDDDLDRAVDDLTDLGYENEFCLAPSVDTDFFRNLAYAGFLIMSTASVLDGQKTLYLPKLHGLRSVLDLQELHESRSAKRLVHRYELRVDQDLETIIDRCAQVHGEDWLTGDLRNLFKKAASEGISGPRPRSFALYRDDRLVAGEFGVATGRIYTSYSGYRDENSSGTVQMILTGRYLQSQGFTHWDLGMPLPYKKDLGSRDLDRRTFIQLFRRNR